MQPTNQPKGTIERYLDRVMAVADLRDPERERQVREELRDHLEQKVAALESEGYDRAEALVKSVEDHGRPVTIGYRLRPWRLVDVRLRGTARGVLAIGPKARGIVAIGGVATGVFAFGGVAIGAVSCGGFALAALLAWGGLAGGAIAYGGLAAGLVAFGGMALGGIASGGAALGAWVPGADQAIWSYYNWATVPHSWRAIGKTLSYDPFVLRAAVWAAITMTFLLVTMGLELFLLVKESNRVRAIDSSIAE